MARRGARCILILSRSGSQTKGVIDLIRELKGSGVKVAAPPCDISDATALETVLAQHLEAMPPIKGCIQSSMVLRVRYAPQIYAIILT
jgi:NAD(P)-dependent dehydrogenase (short-subunit alcohol dehydrogenase family)